MRDCLIILGMHRSGTSALAGAVQRLGVAMGSDLVGAQDDNVRGYYEHRCVLDLHDRLLAARGSAWDDIAPRPWSVDTADPAVTAFQRELGDLLSAEFSEAPLWAVKDPRLCRLFPIWVPVLADLEVRPHLLFAHRSAAEVADSLARRNGFSVEKSYLLWMDHVIGAERASRGYRRAFVEFGRLLQDPIAVLERTALQLEIEWPRRPADRRESLGRFLDPNLRHSPASAEVDSGGVVAAAEAALVAAEDDPLDAAAFDAVAARQRELGTPDALVIEHLHQFARREAAASVWAAKEQLGQELSAVSSRLGKGLANVENAVSELVGESEARTRLAEERRAEWDRTLDHLTEVAAGLETAAEHQDRQLGDLASRLDRLQYEVEVESRLQALRVDLDFLADRFEVLTAQVQRLAARKPWWRRAVDRLTFWRSPESGQESSTT